MRAVGVCLSELKGMTWFKSHIMRQNSPLLLINSSTPPEERGEDNLTSRMGALLQCHREPLDCCNNSKSAAARQKARVRKVEEAREAQSRVERETQEHKLFLLANHHLEARADEHTSARLPNLVPLVSVSTSALPKTKRICQQQQQQQEELQQQQQMQQQQQQHASKCNRAPIRRQSSVAQAMSSKSTSQSRQPAAWSSASRRIKQSEVKNSSAFMGAQLVQFAGARRVALMCALACALLLCADRLPNVIEAASGGQYFEVQPAGEYLVANGHDVRLRCLIRNRQGECLWLRNGRAVGSIAKKYQFTRQPDDGDCSLLIRNVSVQQDDGLWQCQVTASDVEQDTLQSREANLVVLVPPERPQIKNMSQNTQRLILEENKSRLVLCEMRGGNPAPQIEWMLDGKNISKEAQTSSFSAGANSAGATTSSQRITQSKLKMSEIKRTLNGKNLTCVGVHPTLNQSSSVELDVQYVPTVSVVQREYSIVEGSPLSISCQVDANPPPNIVNWRLVSDATSSRLHQNGPTGAVATPTRPGPVLEFERITRENNQNIFECLAQNAYGISLPADVKLNVLYAPFLLNTSHSESVAVGTQAQLACVFDGNPEPEVRWHYTDPLARTATAVQLESGKQQFLTIKNVTYRNEGDYHCEARNQINGVFYGVRSSNIILDVYGEPQFLARSPAHAKAVQGAKSELALAFCADPPPQKVYWQFGSLRLDVRLTGSGTPSGGQNSKHPINQRFQVHPLQPLQKRDSTFSKQPTCFEATLGILEPELTDQRDYTLVVHNERGHQSAVVRLRVSSPLSPVLMITSAFVTICGLFLLSLVAMFLLKRRPPLGGAPNNSSSSGGQANGAANGNAQQRSSEKSAVEHLKNGGLANGQLLQQTRGVVNGSGNGLANQASNPNGQQANLALEHEAAHLKQGLMVSMGAHSNSDTSSANDQKQLLGLQADQRSNSSSAHSASSAGTSQCVDFINGVVSSATNSTSGARSSANSTPTALNQVSVEHDAHGELSESDNNTIMSRSTYRRASPARQSRHAAEQAGALIYANLDYSNHHSLVSSAGGLQTPPGEQHSPRQQQQRQHSAQHSPSQSSLQSIQLVATRQHQQQQQQQAGGQVNQELGKGNLMRSSVGATIAMMNSLAAAASRQSAQAAANGPQSPNSGVLNGAINQQLAAQGRQIRKPGPPKPPKPSIQQRSRFYQQHAAAAGGLVMIGSQMGEQANGYQQQQQAALDTDEPSANELAVEYSRLAFPARAEL